MHPLDDSDCLTKEDLRELSATLGGLIAVLTESEIIDSAEFETARMAALHVIDQESARVEFEHLEALSPAGRQLHAAWRAYEMEQVEQGNVE